MICLRCGYCCKKLCVVIVDDPEKGISQDNLILHDGQHGPCKHLKGDKPGNYSCALHNYSWYKKTPCYQHSQIEQQNQPCRIGSFILKSLNTS